jgi:thiamine-phosphate diphosphorylase
VIPAARFLCRQAMRSSAVPRVDFAPFYPILDVADPGAGDRALVLADAVLAAGAPWLQLRCKATPTKVHLELAREVVARAARAGARVIVNDRIDVALASGAAGVHVGQDDLPIAAVRAAGGRDLVVGVSTHTVREAEQARADGADYVGFGPLFRTTSKSDALAPRTLALLGEVRRSIALPIVAIGGITAEAAPAVLAAGATAVAMIGALASAADPRSFAERLLRPST